MENPHNNELLQKIQENIKSAKPHGRWYGRTILAVRISCMIALAFIATFAMSFFLYDLGEKTSIFEFTQSSVIENIANFLLEFLIISLSGVLGIYIIYRQTDWPFVKERVWLVVGTFILVSGASVGLMLFSKSEMDPWGDFIGDTTRGLTHIIPLRSSIEDRFENDLEDNFYFTGSIIKINIQTDITALTIQNQQKSKTFLMKNGANNFALAPGVKVVIQYTDELDESGLLIKEIKKL